MTPDPGIDRLARAVAEWAMRVDPPPFDLERCQWRGAIDRQPNAEERAKRVALEEHNHHNGFWVQRATDLCTRRGLGVAVTQRAWELIAERMRAEGR